MKYKYIFLDLDGTLTDSKPGIINCIKYALGKMNELIPPEEELNKYVGPPLYVSFTSFNGFDDERARLAIKYYRERFGTVGLFENRAFDGAETFLQRLTANARIPVLATSKPLVYADAIIKKYGLRPYFKVISGAELYGTRDNKYEVIEYAIEQLGSPDRSKILMVGDRKHDILGAKKSGIDSCGVTFGYAEKGELENAGADYLADTFGEIYKIAVQP